MAKAAIYAIFTLGMPNRGSWNGGWSGEGKNYYIIRQVTEAQKKVIESAGARYYHNFGDGWGASISVTFCNGYKERNAAQRALGKSAGFCMYEWMVSNILAHNSTRVPGDD